MVVTNRRPAYSVLSLAVAMLALSGLFVLMQAYFIAIIQILIYAGAILVLFLFVIMVLGIGGSETLEEKTRKKGELLKTKIRLFASFTLPIVFFSELLIVISAIKNVGFSGRNLAGTVEAIGETLFTEYLLPFELISGILLIGIFGVVNLARKELDA